MPTFDTENSTQTYSPPSGLGEIKVIVVASEGASGTESVAGDAGRVEGVLSLSGGETFTAYVAGTVSDGPDGYPIVGAPSPIANGGDANSTVEVSEYGGAGGAPSAFERDGDSLYIALAEGSGGGAGTYNPTYSADHGGGGGARGGSGQSGATDGGGTGEGGDGGTQENLDADPDIPATDGEDGGTTAAAELTSVVETTEPPATPRVEIIDHPRDLSIAAVGYGETNVDVRFDADNAESWTLHRATTSGFTPDDGNQIASFASGGQHTYTDTGVSGGTTHHYVAEATNPAGVTQTAELTQTTALRVPTNVTVANVTADSADVGWDDNSTENAGYRVLVSTDGGSTWTTVADGLAAGATSATVPTTGELDNGTDYLFAVEAHTSDVTARALEVA